MRGIDNGPDRGPAHHQKQRYFRKEGRQMKRKIAAKERAQRDGHDFAYMLVAELEGRGITDPLEVNTALLWIGGFLMLMEAVVDRRVSEGEIETCLARLNRNISKFRQVAQAAT